MLLNEEQNKAANLIVRFMNSKKNNLLMAGAGGTGKTTTIAHAFAQMREREYKIAFCAFTNKATQILKSAAKSSIERAEFEASMDESTVTRQPDELKADFTTIHKLLMLEPRFGQGNTDELSFKFSLKKAVSRVNKYDVLIFDECSIISQTLYNYIQQTCAACPEKLIKCIYLGDTWQLPPVGEDKSIIFDLAMADKWPVAVLTHIMRSRNDLMRAVNAQMAQCIIHFRDNDTEYINKFFSGFPNNFMSTAVDYYCDSRAALVADYMRAWSEVGNNIMLTYGRKSCQEFNFMVQAQIDSERPSDNIESRKMTDEYNVDCLVFKVGDRCCIDKPITLHKIIAVQGTHADALVQGTHVKLGAVITARNADATEPVMLYNGEIFDVIAAEDISIQSGINRELAQIPYFKGQKLKLRHIITGREYEVLHVKKADVTAARKKMMSLGLQRDQIRDIMEEFYGQYPVLTYGYCITVYKAQGSEWDHVSINLNNIFYSLRSAGPHMVFRAAYTAVTRARTSLKVFW